MVKNEVGGIPMKADDYPIVKYQILSTMYDGIKSGRSLNPNEISPEKLGINLKYWQYIIDHMIKSGLIEGVAGVYPHPNDIQKFKLCPKGIDYLFSEPLMEKARLFLNE